MLEITVYGPGCAKCKETEKRVRHALEQAGLEGNVRKASDFSEMARAGVLMTPAVAVNGVVRISGRVPDEAEIAAWLAGAH